MIDLADLPVQMIVAQAFGLIALAISVKAMVTHCDIALKKGISLAIVFLAIHFILLGAYAAAITVTITAARFMSSIYYKKPFLGWIFVALYLGLGLPNCHHWYDYLPIFGSCFATLGVFYLEKIPMRLTLLTSTGLWAVHNIAVYSIGGTLAEILIFTSNLRTILQMHKKQSKP